MADGIDRAARRGLAAVRATCGAILLRAGWSGLAAGAPAGPDLRALLEARQESLPATLAWWSRTVLLENPDAVAWLWRWLLPLVGLALLVGALTRPLGLLAGLLLLHAYAYGSPQLATQHLLLGTCAVICATAGAGRTFGADALLVGTLPSWLTWTEPRKRGW
jgi:uncharacterized membrane protein YphA (DoxX/SURF4 family)